MKARKSVDMFDLAVPIALSMPDMPNTEQRQIETDVITVQQMTLPSTDAYSVRHADRRSGTARRIITTVTPVDGRDRPRTAA